MLLGAYRGQGMECVRLNENAPQARVSAVAGTVSEGLGGMVLLEEV